MQLARPSQLRRLRRWRQFASNSSRVLSVRAFALLCARYPAPPCKNCRPRRRSRGPPPRRFSVPLPWISRRLLPWPPNPTPRDGPESARRSAANFPPSLPPPPALTRPRAPLSSFPSPPLLRRAGRTIPEVFRQTLAVHGPAGFFKGSAMSVVRTVPSKGVQFAACAPPLRPRCPPAHGCHSFHFQTSLPKTSGLSDPRESAVVSRPPQTTCPARRSLAATPRLATTRRPRWPRRWLGRSPVRCQPLPPLPRSASRHATPRLQFPPAHALSAFICAATAGVTSTVTCHPLEMLQTRLVCSPVGENSRPLSPPLASIPCPRTHPRTQPRFPQACTRVSGTSSPP